MTHQSIEEIAGGLSKAQVEALHRLAANMVWVDGRSRNALVRRGLAKVHGQCSDVMLGRFHIVSISSLGLAVRNHLLSKEGRG